MFNIPDHVDIIGLEKTGCKKSHIQACINDKNLHGKPLYSYFGKHVTRGFVLLHTKNGDFTLAFDEKDGVARDLSIIIVKGVENE